MPLDKKYVKKWNATEPTLPDIRSVSRVRKSAVGTNASRIRDYLKRLRLSQEGVSL